MATTMPPDQTQSWMWSTPKTNTVKNSELTRVHEDLHTARPTQKNLKSLLVWVISDPNFAMKGLLFVGHEITFYEKNQARYRTLFLIFKVMQYLIQYVKHEVMTETEYDRGKVQSHIQQTGSSISGNRK